MKRPRYHVWTIGCQMNKTESERLATLLEGRGYLKATAAADADIIVVNSCVVRGHAEDRAANKLAALKPLKTGRPDLILALTGCMVDADIEGLKRRFPYIDHFFHPGAYPPWLGEEGNLHSIVPAHTSVTAYIPIMQGCDNFCSYCIVPYRRGRERSRPPQDIAAEVECLAGRGAREVTLLGQNVDSYGKDLTPRVELADLLETLNAVENLKRIRFLTNHPKDMSDGLIEAVARLEKVCPFICLPAQSGSDRILKAMGRGYTQERYRRLVERIRQAVPGVGISTDIIVGFPGETAPDFQDTYNLLADIRFDSIHVAAYSVRQGTRAARELSDDVPPKVKKERLKQVEALHKEVSTAINEALIGETVEVLVEGKKKDKWYGRTGTDKLVFFQGSPDMRGRITGVKITGAGPWSLQGAEPRLT